MQQSTCNILVCVVALRVGFTTTTTTTTTPLRHYATTPLRHYATTPLRSCTCEPPTNLSSESKDNVLKTHINSTLDKWLLQLLQLVIHILSPSFSTILKCKIVPNTNSSHLCTQLLRSCIGTLKHILTHLDTSKYFKSFQDSGVNNEDPRSVTP